MANRIERNVVGEIDKLNENDSLALLSYIPELLASPQTQSKDSAQNEDIIVSLSDAYENIRARQVSEWERLPPQNVHRSA